MEKISGSGHARRLFAAIAVVALGGCSTVGMGPPPSPGTPLEALLQRWGPASGTYPLDDGAQRVEFAQGPYGKTTFMVDLDAQQRITRTEQVLDEPHFERVRAGMSQREVLTTLGRPGRVWAVRYHDQTVWSYRYESPFCKMFSVGLTPDGVVEDTSYGPDPLCDHKNRGDR